MIYTFEQSTGKIFDSNNTCLAVCYAGGNCGNAPEGVNNPAMQNVSCVGPLPVGLYSLGAAIEGTKLGVFAIPLIPDPANEMHGRSGFFLHGDNSAGNESASEGCIVAPPSIRHMIYNSPNAQIRVVAHN